MQASVHRQDPTTGAGSVLLDDGVELPFTAEAFADSSLRLLRPGQRVTVRVTGEGADAVVTALWLVGVTP